MFWPSQKGEFTESAYRCGQEVARLVHDIYGLLAIGNSHVHVQAENEIATRDLLHVLHNCCVALVGGNELVHPMRKRVRASSSNL